MDFLGGSGIDATLRSRLAARMSLVKANAAARQAFG
jgi:hypothetical protein